MNFIKQSMPMKIPSDCLTRWLSIQPAVKNIIALWLELKAHRKIARLSEKYYSAELLFEMYSEEKKNRILAFLQPILAHVQKTNKLLASRNVEVK